LSASVSLPTRFRRLGEERFEAAERAGTSLRGTRPRTGRRWRTAHRPRGRLRQEEPVRLSRLAVPGWGSQPAARREAGSAAKVGGEPSSTKAGRPVPASGDSMRRRRSGPARASTLRGGEPNTAGMLLCRRPARCPCDRTGSDLAVHVRWAAAAGWAWPSRRLVLRPSGCR
jgi:hypothetical protein